MKELLELIKKEDKKNPLTDDEICKAIGICRSNVIKLRHSLGIGNSRERKKELLEKELKKIMLVNSSIPQRVLTKKLKERGYKVSRNIVSKYLNEIEKQVVHQKVAFDQNQVKTQDISPSAFSRLIGEYGSLKPQIELAKAAVLYPPNGLSALIYGATGVGKSQLAECMYKFSLESAVKDNNCPFVVFNCADYAGNPQLLLAQLFGHKKGAFTGADSDKEGLVAKADNGILFLDEVHRLPPEGQELLFYFMDKGKYRRLGETDTLREAKVMIIAATTENIESVLLTTFRRRMPIIIELPPLSKRPLEERFELVREFFRQEVTRINVNMVVSYNVVVAFLLYDNKGNVGQLRSDIQVACAHGFLKYMIQKSEQIRIDIDDVPVQVVRGLLKINKNRNLIQNLEKEDMKISLANKFVKYNIDSPEYIFPKDIYKEIEDDYTIMEKKGIKTEIIDKIISNELETKIQQLVTQARFYKNNLAKQDLEKIVGGKIILAVGEMLSKAKTRLNNIDESLFYCLATHLSSLYERIRQNKPVTNPRLKEIKDEYSEEYRIAKELTKIASSYLDVALPEDETAFIAMYLKAYSIKNKSHTSHVGVLVMSHGQVAEGMAYVANSLLNVNHAKAIEMQLDESPEAILERAINIVKLADMGKGVIILADMGSLISFGEIITTITGIPVKTIARVDTQMVIEAVRKAMLPEADINEIAHALRNDKFSCIDSKNEIERKTSVILSICLTGEGTANMIKSLIKNCTAERGNQIKIITLGALTEYNIQDVIHNLSLEHNILAIISTLDIEIKGIPFISVKEIVKGEGLKRLRKLIDIKTNSDIKRKNSLQKTSNLINSKLIVVNINFTNKNDILEYMSEMMCREGYVSESFILSVHKREVVASTFFKTGVALPHGNTEDVYKPGICIATLSSPVEWDNGKFINCVFMLALKDYHKEEFKKLYSIISNKNILEKIKKSNSIEELEKVIQNACLTCYEM